ncbi:MAG: sigma-70 family RNA polymerase sigma factor [Bryobacteraceae bacterium]|jgi:RNA polymerase sigma-70 factor (ECF subfamily)
MLVIPAIDSLLTISMNGESHLPDAGTGAQPARARTPPADPALSALVAEMALGNQHALGRLYDETAPSLNGLLLRILGQPQETEEALMDVYMKAWKNAASYSPARGGVRAWLAMMARSIAIDRIRRRATRLDAAVAPERIPEPASTEASPEEQTVQGEWRSEVRRALDELPREQREALTVAFFEGLSHTELAARLGQPLGTVKSRVRVGLLRLREILEARRAV